MASTCGRWSSTTTLPWKTAFTPPDAAALGPRFCAEKLCGAAAERGYDLARVEALCRKVNGNGRSMGMALTSCTVPAAGKPTFELGENEMEMGIGIHGEPGRERMPLLPAAELTERMAATVLADLPFRGGDQVIAMVNGMGGTPLMELYLVYGELERILRGHGNPRRAPPGGELHHQPRYGRLLHHAAQGR